MMTGKVKWYLLILWFVLTIGDTLEARALIKDGDMAGASARMLPAVLVGLLFLFLVWLQPRLAARKAILRSVEWRITDEGVQIRTNVAATDIRWEAYLKYKEGKKIFLLYVQKGQAQMIPKRVLSESETIELRNLISAHVKKA